LTERIKAKAYELGFDLIGIAPANRAPHADAYRRWLSRGYAANMHWLGRNPERREDPRNVIPGAQSVLVVGLSYFLLDPPPEWWHDPSRGRIARYAWGLDYHHVMLPRLRELGEFVDKEVGHPLNQRSYVDTGPVLERDFAAQAGLGFVGKNTLLINPGLGSYLFLGEILIDLELDYDEPSPDGGARCRIPGESKRAGTCGNCTRCLDICPTHAFPAPYILDSNRCISYLTIELKDNIPTELRPLLGNRIYGCDECQEICPWMRRYNPPTGEIFLRYDPEQAIPKLLDLIKLDEANFRKRFKDSPVSRTKRRGLLRNVAVALGNWGSPEALPALEAAAVSDSEALIREHANWAINRIKQN